MQATKPNVPVVDFKRYEKTKEKENLDLKMVMQREEESKAKFVEKKKEAKEKFAVDKVFPKRAGD